jgi:hypothetical protein
MRTPAPSMSMAETIRASVSSSVGKYPFFTKLRARRGKYQCHRLAFLGVCGELPRGQGSLQ